MIDYSNIISVCFDCTKAAGFTLKKKIVGAWIGECEICHKQKPCTDLLHDWNPTNLLHDWKPTKTESEVKDGK